MITLFNSSSYELEMIVGEVLYITPCHYICLALAYAFLSDLCICENEKNREDLYFADTVP